MMVRTGKSKRVVSVTGGTANHTQNYKSNKQIGWLSNYKSRNNLLPKYYWVFEVPPGWQKL